MRKFVIFNVIFLILSAISPIVAAEQVTEKTETKVDNIVVRAVKHEYRILKNLFTSSCKLVTRQELSVADSQDLRSLGKQAAIITVLAGGTGFSVYNRASLLKWWRESIYPTIYQTLKAIAERDKKGDNTKKEPTSTDTPDTKRNNDVNEESSEANTQKTTTSEPQMSSTTTAQPNREKITDTAENTITKNKSEQKDNSATVRRPLPATPIVNNSVDVKKTMQNQDEDNQSSLGQSTQSSVESSSDMSAPVKEEQKSLEQQENSSSSTVSPQKKKDLWTQAKAMSKKKSIERKITQEAFQQKLQEQQKTPQTEASEVEEEKQDEKEQLQVTTTSQTPQKPSEKSKLASEEQVKDWQRQAREQLQSRQQKMKKVVQPSEEPIQNKSSSPQRTKSQKRKDKRKKNRQQIPQADKKEDEAKNVLTIHAKQQQANFEVLAEVTEDDNAQMDQLSKIAEGNRNQWKQKIQKNMSSEKLELPKPPTLQTTVVTVSTSEQVASDNELANELTSEEKEEENKNRPTSPLTDNIKKIRKNLGGTAYFGDLGRKIDSQRAENKDKPLKLSTTEKKLINLIEKAEQKKLDLQDKAAYDSLTKQQIELGETLYKATQEQSKDQLFNGEAFRKKIEALRNANSDTVKVARNKRPAIPQFDNTNNTEKNSEEENNEWT